MSQTPSHSNHPEKGVWTNATIEQLLEAFRQGDERAGNVLFQRYQPWLKLLARVQVETQFHQKFDPSDVVQQTMIEACRAASGFRGNTEPEWQAWLRRILAHVLAHEIRRYRGTKKRDITRENSLEQWLDESSARLGRIPAADNTSPSQALARHERSTLLAAALEQLPEDHREVIILRDLEGLAHEEIAQRMQRRPGAVRMLWMRALANLQKTVREMQDRLPS